MKFLFITIAALIFFQMPAFGKTELDDCYKNAFTQKELNACSSTNYKAADAELNRVYQLIKRVYKDDPVFIEKLKLAQRAWIKFRDASFEMKYPHHKDRYYYGSAFSMCSRSYLAELTITRIAELKVWLKGIEEGDVCCGSVKRPYEIKHSQSRK